MPNHNVIRNRQSTTSPVDLAQNGAELAGLTAELAPLYGDQSAVQAERYVDALTQFSAFAGPGPAWLFRAPGRVNLIGEHTDYNNGFVMPIALDRDILLVVRPRRDRTVRLANIEPEFEQSAFTVSEEIPQASPGHWSNYVRGAAQMIARLAPDAFTGMDCLAVGAASRPGAVRSQFVVSAHRLCHPRPRPFRRPQSASRAVRPDLF